MKMRNKKLLLLGALAFILCFSAPVWSASQTSAAEDGTTAESTPDDRNDPEYYKYHSDTYGKDKMSLTSRSMTTASETLTTFSGGLNSYTGGIEFRHNSRYENYIIYDGIDVSKWQATIDWQKVKASGIDYAFIRCGYSGLANGSLNTDAYFAANMKNANAAGVKIGVYYYSQSKTTAEAIAEANYTLKLIEPYRSYISLPVVYDFETPSTSRAKGLSKAKVTANTIAFCNTIENAGYDSMYYGSPTMLSSSFDTSQLEQYPCWLAHYPETSTVKSFYTSYTGNYLFWQYCSFGKVNGISGDVDMNFYYAASATNNYVTSGQNSVTGFVQETNTSTSATFSWVENPDVDGYLIYRSSAPNGTYKRMVKISESSTTTWTDSTLAKNRQYYYKIRAYKKIDGKTYCSTMSSALPGHANAYSGTYRRATTALNVRRYPGTAYSRITTISKNTKVQLLYKTMAKGGSIWYKISWSGMTGYVSGNYLKK